MRSALKQDIIAQHAWLDVFFPVLCYPQATNMMNKQNRQKFASSMRTRHAISWETVARMGYKLD